MTTLNDADVALDFVFEAPEIDLIVSVDEPKVSARANAIPDHAASAAAMPDGGLWRLGKHRLIHGDARDPQIYQRLMGSVPARAVTILTDPPYNVGANIVSGLRTERQGKFLMGAGELSVEAFIAFLTEALGAAVSVLVDGGLLYSFIDWRHVRHLAEAGERLGLTFINMAVWVKSQGGMGSLYRSRHELCPIFKKGDAPHVNNVKLGRHGRDRCNVWSYPGANTARAALSEHATPKSVEMISDAILDVTHRGDIVLDPFMGSGTTLVSAEKVGRIAYGVELDPRFVDAILRRWQTLTGGAAILEDTGETYDEVLARHASQPEVGERLGADPHQRPRIRVQAGTSKREEA